MIAIKKKLARRNKIRARIRSRVSGTATKPRLSVFRSNSHIYAQLIDDLQGVTLASASSFKVEGGGPRAVSSKIVGLELAKAAVSAGVSEVIFDRGGYLFHGRVKALAEGAREGGLKF